MTDVYCISRAAMPQIDESDLQRLIADAFKAQIPFEFGAHAPRALNTHQRVQWKRAKAMPLALVFKPSIISSDGYVIDGNHRRAKALLERVELLPTLRMGVAFGIACEWLLSLPYVYTLTATTPERN